MIWTAEDIERELRARYLENCERERKQMQEAEEAKGKENGGG